ncbi:phosphoribosylanthranilate isomerase [Candidatus Pelagibacter sp.]|nr:phosphoribosylanthranilate isomerase [Candidatus Pelagibacter sp.]MDC0465823.1 phosphoribosylanthranilate isomerase [Candidatus Pelagibacter sp.]
MIKGSKICGISDLDTLNFIINHPYPPQFIGFICNYKKSSRYVGFETLNELLKLDKKKSNFVAVLVKPDQTILEEIKNLPFDYYQIYDSTPDEIKEIKQKYNKKIITALTVSNQDDINKYKAFEDVADILLFDSKGYEKTQSFNHNFLDSVNSSKPIMVAGDIKTDDLNNFKDKPFLIDVSGNLESEKGVKDINKIDKFLNTVHNISS